jgi:uncharacterized protein
VPGTISTPDAKTPWFYLLQLDRTEMDRRLLTYTSAPLERDIEITGHPVVTLQASTSADDGAFFVYLEDVDPGGHVTYITDGQMRPMHRKVSTEKPPYTIQVPYHSLNRKDALFVPGAVQYQQSVCFQCQAEPCC